MEFWERARSLRVVFETNITEAIRTLLQQRHLYQSIEVAPTHRHSTGKPNGHDEVTERVFAAINAPWLFERPPAKNPLEWCQVLLPHVKLSCARCDRIEAYNVTFSEDVFLPIPKAASEGTHQAAAFKDNEGTHQAFVLVYTCQSCKGAPDVFLVRRRGLKLTIEGRSPIEHVAVPPFVPKPVKRFFGGAIVAHQSGQTLAGLFLLRTVIEQWARVASGSTKEQADQVLDDYIATLPEDFKGRFPSMRALYADLSVDIHTASGSVELFDKARLQIVEHFDARRMFKLGVDGPSDAPTS